MIVTKQIAEALILEIRTGDPQGDIIALLFQNTDACKPFTISDNYKGEHASVEVRVTKKTMLSLNEEIMKLLKEVA